MSTPTQAKSAFEYLLSHDHRVKLKYDPKPFWKSFDAANKILAKHDTKIKVLSWEKSHDKALTELVPAAISFAEGKSFVLTTDSNITRGITSGAPIKLIFAVASKEDLVWLKDAIHSTFEGVVAKGIHSKIDKLNFKRMGDAEANGIKLHGSAYKFFEFAIKLVKMPKAVKA